MERIWRQRYQPHVPKTIDESWRRHIPDLLEQSFATYRNHPAFANLGVTLSFGDIDRLSAAFASYLQRDLGLRKGDRVALMMPNILQYPVALFGLLRAGMVAVNVNPLYTARELKHQLNDSGAETIVIMENFAAVLAKIIGETPVKNVIVTGLGDLFPPIKGALVNLVVKRLKKLIPPWRIDGAVKLKRALKRGAAEPFTAPELDAEDIAFLQYTGGTTGVAKGAVLTHRNIVCNVAQAMEWISGELTEGGEVMVTPLPLYHIFSLTGNCFVFTALGGLNVLITNPRDIPQFIAELRRWPFTAMTGVNTLFNALLNHPEFATLNFNNFKMALGGGMAVQRPVAERWQEITKKPLVEAYGLTETSPGVCINPMDLKGYSGYIGLPLPSTDVSIRDERGAEMPIGESGELCIRGPQVMREYWNRPEETEQAFHPDRWFRSGDVAVMNEEGFFKIVDRQKDMILVSGFNVFPNEIEEVVAGHEGVLEAAAVGVPDEKSSEAVKLFIVRKNPNLTEAEITAYCREHLTGYKRPKYIEFRRELPKTNVGKILRRALREPEASS